MPIADFRKVLIDSGLKWNKFSRDRWRNLPGVPSGSLSICVVKTDFAHPLPSQREPVYVVHRHRTGWGLFSSTIRMILKTVAISWLSTHMQQLVDSLSCWVSSPKESYQNRVLFPETPRGLGVPEIAATTQEMERYVSIPCIHMYQKTATEKCVKVEDIIGEVVTEEVALRGAPRCGSSRVIDRRTHHFFIIGTYIRICIPTCLKKENDECFYLFSHDV